MNARIINILTGLFFAILLTLTGILQSDLKAMPQLVMIAFGIVTLVSFIFIPGSMLTTLLFYTVTGFMLYCAFFELSEYVVDFLYPERGWIEHEGGKKRVMDMSWIWSVAVGFVLSPLTLVLYHRSKLRNPSLEMGVCALFLVMTVVIYIVLELG